jgi:hypothetical protein
MGVSNIDGDDSGGNSPAWQGAGTEISVPRNLYSMVAALQNFMWMETYSFRVFASGAIYRRKGGVGGCGHPGLPPGIPVMHTIHDPRKTIVNPHNRVGITEYIIHYITSSNSLTWPLG